MFSVSLIFIVPICSSKPRKICRRQSWPWRRPFRELAAAESGKEGQRERPWDRPERERAPKAGSWDRNQIQEFLGCVMVASASQLYPIMYVYFFFHMPIGLLQCGKLKFRSAERLIGPQSPGGSYCRSRSNPCFGIAVQMPHQWVSPHCTHSAEGSWQNWRLVQYT